MSGVLLLSPCCRVPLYRYAVPLQPGMRLTSRLAQHLAGDPVREGERVARCPRCGATPNLHRLIQQEACG